LICLDFWEIAAYAEMDVKGNVDIARKMIMRGVSNHEKEPRFRVALFKFELNFLNKLFTRRKALCQPQTNKDSVKDGFDFIDDDEKVMQSASGHAGLPEEEIEIFIKEKSKIAK
jgi:hypothetical protein